MSLTEPASRPKVRKTITLDADLAETFGQSSANLSATVNAILRAERDRLARAASIRQLADDLDGQYGPADTEATAAAVAALRS